MTNDAQNFDVVIIGAGPGGYVAAIKAAQLGFKTAIVEADNVGGTCLNWGCIPSKVLLEDSKRFADLKHFSKYGIKFDNASFDFSVMNTRKENIIKTLTGGVMSLLTKNGVTVFRGWAKFINANTFEIRLMDSHETPYITGKNIILAVGGQPAAPPMLKFDHQRIIDSNDVLFMKKVPESMAIVGGGVIGLEMGSVYNNLGTKVFVVEMMDTILPGFDLDICKEATRLYKKQGIEILTSCKVEKAQKTDLGMELSWTDANEKLVSKTADVILVATGRRPNTANLGLENTNIKTDKGYFVVNEHLQTSEPNVYAIGDCVVGLFLAHKASADGEAVVEFIKHGYADFNKHIPGAVFTVPEIATVGLTEQQAVQKGKEVKIGKFPFRVLGKSMAIDEIDGFVKVIADNKTDTLLGVHIIGAHASDLIAESTMALELEASLEDYQSAVRTHPTLSEALTEAALAADNKAIHMINK